MSAARLAPAGGLMGLGLAVTAPPAPVPGAGLPYRQAFCFVSLLANADGWWVRACDPNIFSYRVRRAYRGCQS